MIEPQYPHLSIRRLCDQLGLGGMPYTYASAQENTLNLTLMPLIDAQYLKTSFRGYRRMTVYLLLAQGHAASPRRVQQLMHRVMGIQVSRNGTGKA